MRNGDVTSAALKWGFQLEEGLLQNPKFPPMESPISGQAQKQRQLFQWSKSPSVGLSELALGSLFSLAVTIAGAEDHEIIQAAKDLSL